MKKIIFSLFIFPTMISAVAQKKAIGLRSGITISGISGDSRDSPGYNSIASFYGTAFYVQQVGNVLYIQPEISWLTQGGQRDGILEISAFRPDIPVSGNQKLFADVHSTLRLNYINLSALAKLELGTRLKYFFCFGPFLSTLVRAKTDLNGSSLIYGDADGKTQAFSTGPYSGTLKFDESVNIHEKISQFNFGIEGGAGITFTAGKGRVVLDGRTTIGLTNIWKDSETNGNDKTGSFTLSVGYQFIINQGAN
ncbi:outer membrane beta-barrel protein [Pollutibacter soli]|uniref:outer membrane beta-barrel protein n=1 Tax=Pollutibacter soli TaxID=3034157 RepID=UPI003013B1AF